MTGQYRELDEVGIYVEKINALGLSAEQSKDNATSKDIDVELDYTLKAAARHLSIWGPGVRAVNFRVLTVRLEKILNSLPAEQTRYRQVLSLALEFFEHGIGQISETASEVPYQGQRSAM